MHKIVSLAIFLFGVIGSGLVIGMLTVPGAWHAALIKPSFNPPNWVFGPVWTILYTFIAIAGWRTWRNNRSGLAMKAWWMQLLLNFLWSPLFFVAHRMDGAFVVIGLLLVTIITFIASGWHRDRIAALLFVPYAAWVAFASALNGAILYLN